MPPEQSPLKQIRTFQGDVAEALKKQQESLVSIQQAQRLKTGPVVSSAPAEDTKRRKQFFFLFVGSLVLLVLGATGAWYVYNKFIEGSTTPISAAPANRFVSANSAINLDLATTSRDSFISALAGAAGNVAPGELRHIVLRKPAVLDIAPLLPINEFLERLDSQAPGNLVRSFDDLFMFGALGGNPPEGGTSTFLIIKLASFENAFAGMLAWEQNIASDIGPLFATARLLANVPAGTMFQDVTERNKDIRVLTVEGEPALLYTFFDNNMLIITDNMETVRSLIDRLTREKLSQ